VGNRFVQIRIKLVAFGFDRFQSVVRKQIVQLLLNQNHSGIDRRFITVGFGGR
jgi:hypothetical protein